MAITLPPDEFPAGYNLTAVLDVRNVEPKSILKLACSEDVGTPFNIQIGEQNATYSLQQLSSDQLFVSCDTSMFPAGCLLQAMIDNGKTGRSQPFTLAHIVRLPQIDSFDGTSQVQPDGKRTYELKGRNLEMIEKAGWDQLEGVPITVLPTPIQGQGLKQALQVNLPDPAPAHGNLFVWLRGEKNASATTLAAPLKPLGPGISSGGAPSAGPDHRPSLKQ